MDMPTNSPEAQENCPACGEPSCLDHALRTAPLKAEAQPQGVEMNWRSQKAHEAIYEAAELIANRYCDEDDTYSLEVKRLTVAISGVVDRADLPRATAFRPMCDDPECSVCKRMAELHAENAPSVTGETTVETALAELREMFPHNELSIQFVSSSPIDQWWQITVGNKTFYGQRNANPRLADCMAQVRTATRTEGEGEKSNE